MGDAGEVKAKVTIEYDGSGIDKAKEDLASLADIVGGQLSESAGTASDNLAGLDEQMGGAAESTRALTSSVAALEKPMTSGGDAITSVTEAMGEHQAMIADTSSAYESLQKPIEATTALLEEASPSMLAIAKSAESMQGQMEDLGGGFNVVEGSLSQVVPMLPQLADNLHSVSEELAPQAKSFDAYTSNFNAFQDALASPAPFNAIQQHLNDTGQTWDDFAGTIGTSKSQMVSDIRQSQVATTSALGDIQSSVVETGQAFTDNLKETDAFTQSYNSMGDTVAEANKQMGGFNETLGETSKGINEFGSAGSAISGGGGEALGLGEILGSAGTGALDMMNTIAMPIMAAQQIGMVIGTVSTGMYNMAAVAEGPAAHSLGSFTGTVDALGQSAQKSASAFSEGFGQGVLPTLNALNAQTSGGNDFFSMSGKWLGTNLSALGDFLEMSSGINAVGGFQGLVNTGASMLGMQQPFQGPGPTSATSSGSNYAQIQTQISQIPISLAVSTATMQAQANSPAYLAAQAYLGSQTQIAQTAQQSYNVSHYGGTSGPNDPLNAIFQQQLNPLGYGGTPNPNAAFFNSFPGGPDVAQSGMSNANSMQSFQNWLNYAGGSTPAGLSFTRAAGSTIGNIGNWWSNLFGGGDNASGPTSNVQANWAGSGCFPAGTQVLMTNRTTKSIETLVPGDSVLAHDGSKQVVTSVLARIKPLPKLVYALSFSDGNTLTLTDSHPIATDQGWKSLSPRATKLENPGLTVTALQIGDNIHAVDGPCTLECIKPVEIVPIYNISVGDPHTFYADGILVHNKVGADIMSQVADTTIPQTDLKGSNLISSLASNFSSADLTHTFTASVTWADQGLNHAATAAAQWAESNLVHSATAAAQWAEQGLTHMATAAATWAEQGLTHAATAAATWAESNLIHPAVAAATWAEQGLMHAATAVAQWADNNLVHPVVAAAQWADQNLIHPVVAAAQWEGQNLEHQFVGIATWAAQGLNAVFSAGGSTPGFASGVQNFGGGWAVTGEGGPELVYLPQGASVYPHSAGFTPLNIGDNSGGGMITVNVTHMIQLDSRTIAQATIPYIAPMARAASGRRQ